METSRRTWNGEGKKKTVVKIGGGGIGAVILLGGALATAALASALAVRAGRSSAKDRGRNQPPEEEKLSGEDEAEERKEIVFCDGCPCEGGKKEVESDNGTEGFLVCTRSSTLDEESKIEINGGSPGDFEASDKILCSKNLEKDDGFVIVDEDSPPLEEKWPLESQKMMAEDEENTNCEKVCNEEEKGAERQNNDHVNGEIEASSCKDGIEVAENDVEVVQIDETKGEERGSMILNMEKNELEACSSVDGEISEEKCVEVIERAKVDMSEDSIDQEAINNVDTKEEEQEDEGVVQELESVVEHENLDGDEKESALSYETLQIVQEGESNEERRENVEKLIVYEEKGVVPELESVVEHENVDDDEREGAVSPETLEIVQEDESNEERQESVEKLVEDEEKSVVTELESVNEHENVDGDERGSAVFSETVEIVQEDETIEEIGENVEKLVEDEEKCAVPELESVVEHENVDGDEGESALFSETVKIVQEDETIEEIHKNVEEKLVEEEEKCDEGIVPEKCEEVESIDGATQTDQLCSLIDKKEEEVLQMIDSEFTKELIISPKYVEIANDSASEEVPESLELNENHAMTQYPVSQKDNVEEKMIHHESYAAAKDDIVNEQTDESTEDSEHKSSDEDEEEEDSVITTESSEDGETKDEIVEESSVESSDSSTESNSEVVRPAESAKAKLVSYEVEGKILEDNQTNYHKSITSEKSFINKYMAKRTIMIGMVSLLLSLSCSWYFDLSFVKLCLVLFLTMAVASEIHGY